MRASNRRPTPWQRFATCWRANPALTAIVVVALLLGLLLRLYALGRGTINSDGAVVGLIARGILHGHFFAFYWAENYGGTEAYAVAMVFALFGSSAFTLGLTPVLLCGASLVILWRVGNRMFATRSSSRPSSHWWSSPWSARLAYGRSGPHGSRRRSWQGSCSLALSG
ncbi:MAG: hypothetical protein ABSC31_14575 [Acidimicrobiales bacterium]